METIKWMECVLTFVRVSKLGSFSDAAKELNCSKSHVSKIIKALEDELGTAVFLRSTRKVQLTSVGEEFLENAIRSLDAFESTKLHMNQNLDAPRGTLRVTTAGVFGEDYIAPVLIKMAKKYPELKIEMNFDTRIVDLIKERYDVGIRIGPLPNSSLVAQKIASRKEFVCASIDYVKKHKRLIRPQDLQEHNCLGAMDKWRFKIDNRLKDIRVSGNLKTNNPRVALRAAIEGLGIIRLPGSYVFEEIKMGRLVELLSEYHEGKKDIWAVTAPKQNQNINVKTFLSELKNHLSSDYSDVLF